MAVQRICPGMLQLVALTGSHARLHRDARREPHVQMLPAPEVGEGLGRVVPNIDDVVRDELQHQLLEVAVGGVPLQPLHLQAAGEAVITFWDMPAAAE